MQKFARLSLGKKVLKSERRSLSAQDAAQPLPSQPSINSSSAEFQYPVEALAGSTIVRVITRIGLCGFTMSMKDYARHFPVVEVQSTFYEPPRDEVINKWPVRTGEFPVEYTMKVWQLVTHAANSPTYRRMKRPLNPKDAPGFFRNTRIVREGWQRSVECAELISATAMLFQCPASFTPDRTNVRRMRKFFERIERPSARLLWEPRGAKWVAERELALSLCQELDLVHVVDPFVTQPERGHQVYWRLHGITGPRHSYTDTELQQLHRMLLDTEPNAPAYIMFNNLPRIGDAKRFERMLTQPNS